MYMLPSDQIIEITMNWKEEEKKFELKFQELIEDKALTKQQKRQIKELKKKLDGHLYDPTFLTDWVKNIPFYGTWDEGTKDEVSLNVVAVISSFSMHDFYYLGFDTDGKLHVRLCNEPHSWKSDNIFALIGIEDMKKQIHNAMFPDDELLIFKTEKNDKQLVK